MRRGGKQFKCDGGGGGVKKTKKKTAQPDPPILPAAQKTSLKKEFALPQTLSRFFHLV